MQQQLLLSGVPAEHVSQICVMSASTPGRPLVTLGSVSGSTRKLRLSAAENSNNSSSADGGGALLHTPTPEALSTAHTTSLLPSHVMSNHYVLEQNLGHSRNSDAASIEMKNYSLQDWKEYSLLKFADNKRFQRSPHGKRIIVANALRDYGKDVRMLVEYVENVEQLAREMENELAAERDARLASNNKVYY